VQASCTGEYRQKKSDLTMLGQTQKSPVHHERGHAEGFIALVPSNQGGFVGAPKPNIYLIAPILILLGGLAPPGQNSVSYTSFTLPWKARASFASRSSSIYFGSP